jgi:simple sugar transport system permease protein
MTIRAETVATTVDAAVSATRGRDLVFAAGRVVLPIALALIVGAVILLAFGKDPIAYYGYVVDRGLLRWTGLQATLTRAAPLLLIAAGLIVAFRAGIWNLGVDGQFLLGAVMVAALSPMLIGAMPAWIAITLCFAIAFVVGMVM